MADNSAAERVVRKQERDKQKAEAMKKMMREGLGLMLEDIKTRASLAREMKEAASGNSRQAYEEWKKKWSDRFDGPVGSEFTGFDEDRFWERD